MNDIINKIISEVAVKGKHLMTRHALQQLLKDKPIYELVRELDKTHNISYSVSYPCGIEFHVV